MTDIDVRGMIPETKGATGIKILSFLIPIALVAVVVLAFFDGQKGAVRNARAAFFATQNVATPATTKRFDMKKIAEILGNKDRTPNAEASPK